MLKIIYKILTAGFLSFLLMAVLADKFSSAAITYDFGFQKTGQVNGVVKMKTVLGSQLFDFDCGYQSYGFYLNGVIGSDCYGSGVGSLESGTQINLYAESEPLYLVFGGWTGCTPSASNPFFCSFVLNANTLVQAQFKSAYSLAIIKKGTGDGVVNVISPAGAQFINCGGDCYEEFPASFNRPLSTSLNFFLGATADSDSQLVGWDGCDSVSGSACSVSNLFQKKITAIFNRFPRTLTIGKSGTGGGVVTSDPAGIYCGSGADCSAQFGQGNFVSLTAFKDAGSAFAGWLGCESVNGANCTVIMGAGNKTVTAQFNPL